MFRSIFAHGATVVASLLSLRDPDDELSGPPAAVESPYAALRLPDRFEEPLPSGRCGRGGKIGGVVAAESVAGASVVAHEGCAPVVS